MTHHLVPSSAVMDMIRHSVVLKPSGSIGFTASRSRRVWARTGLFLQIAARWSDFDDGSVTDLGSLQIAQRYSGSFMESYCIRSNYSIMNEGLVIL
jgi:hypothetical protein